MEDDPLPDDDCFDILNFWKSDLKYPTLQKIGRDILAIPVSTVASKSAFSKGGRIVSPHRSRLHAKNVGAMMCLQNLLTEDIKGDISLPYDQFIDFYIEYLLNKIYVLCCASSDLTLRLCATPMAYPIWTDWGGLGVPSKCGGVLTGLF